MLRQAPRRGKRRGLPLQNPPLQLLLRLGLALGDRGELDPGALQQTAEALDLFLGRGVRAEVGHRRGSAVKARLLAKASFEFLESLGEVASGQRDLEAHPSPA